MQALIIGGCCGTSPEYTRQLRRMADARRVPTPRAYEPACVLCSAQEAVALPVGVPRIAVIGERINPTGKPKLRQRAARGRPGLPGGGGRFPTGAGRRRASTSTWAFPSLTSLLCWPPR